MKCRICDDAGWDEMGGYVIPCEQCEMGKQRRIEDLRQQLNNHERQAQRIRQILNQTEDTAMSKIVIELEDVNEDGIDKIRTVVRFTAPKNQGLPTKAQLFAQALNNVIEEANGSTKSRKH